MAKFCRKCGRPLRDGEVCNCDAQAQTDKVSERITIPDMRTSTRQNQATQADRSGQRAQASRTDWSDQTERTSQRAQASRTDWSDQTERTGQRTQASRTDWSDQAERTGQRVRTEQADRSGQRAQTSRTDWSDQADRSGQRVRADQADRSSQRAQASRTDQMSRTSRTRQRADDAYYEDEDYNAGYYEDGSYGDEYYDDRRRPNRRDDYYDDDREYRQRGAGRSGLADSARRGSYDRNRRAERSREADWLYDKKDALVAGTINMFAEILPILKAPMTRVRELVKSGNAVIGIEFIVAKFVAYLVPISILLWRLYALASRYGGQVSLPIFRIILMLALLTMGLDFLRALIMQGTFNLFGCRLTYGGSATVIGVGAMYETMLGLLGGLLLCADLYQIGFVLICVGMVTSLAIEYGGYMLATKSGDGRKPYAYLLGRLVHMLVLWFIIKLMLDGILTSLSGGEVRSVGDFFNFLS